MANTRTPPWGIVVGGLPLLLLLVFFALSSYWKESAALHWATASAIVQSDSRQRTMTATTYSLPPLPYGFDALEPHISKQIMELHHDKHHQTYVNNLNAALATLTNPSTPVTTQINLQAAVKFNGGGHINHSLFWENLAPASSSVTKIDSAAPGTAKAINEQWGSYTKFQEAFEKTLLGIQGSGWGWLVKTTSGSGKESMRIVTTKDQDPVVDEATVPLMGVDMWEHAYYLQYFNNKTAYAKGIFNVINWQIVEERFKGKREDAFKALKASM